METILIAASSLGERFKLMVIFDGSALICGSGEKEWWGYISRSGEVLPWTRGKVA